ncbi:hypothetical protein FACS18949_14290 [Clostridia bacterium]|nr:hypothetical protein FACS189425_07100 [Clostridia bacterium]GHV35744.1 hypothetical protein FACS18949_14290 [Clostridia bacterium]
MVTMVNYTQPSWEGDKTVILNGKAWRIKGGETVKLPKAVFKLIEQSKAQHNAAAAIRAGRVRA